MSEEKYALISWGVIVWEDTCQDEKWANEWEIAFASWWGNPYGYW